MVAVIIVGAAGRMGQMLVTQAHQSSDHSLAGATERPDADCIGKDIGEVAGLGSIGVGLTSEIPSQASSPAVIIDFTAPAVTLKHVEVALANKFPIVIGTTGFTDEQKSSIEKASQTIPIVMAPNMSVGVNTLFKLAEMVPQILGDGYDIEVVEAHHRLKKDAPSGTAVRLGEILAENSNRSYPQDANFHREGIIGERTDQEIGMQVIRGGDIVGEHTVYFCGQGERVEIKHIATSRKTFADGALRAASWVVDKQPGLYSMQDVLAIK